MKGPVQRLAPRRLVPLIALLLLAAAPAAGAEPEMREFAARAPLPIRDLTLPNTLILGFRPTSAFSQPKGSWQLSVMYSHASHFIQSENVAQYLERTRASGSRPLTPGELDEIFALEGDVFFIDGEVGIATFEVSYGLGCDLELGLSLPYLVFGGGGLDDTIQDFHDLVGVSQNGRELIPRNQYTVIIDVGPGEGSRYAELGPRTSRGLGDPTLSLSYELPLRLGSWSFGAELAVKIPIANRSSGLSTGNLDAGVQLAAQRSFGRHELVINGGYVLVGDFEGTATFDPADKANLSIDWVHPLRGSVRGSLQLLTSDSVFESNTSSALAETEFQASYGVYWMLSPRTLFGVGLTENFLNFNNTTDIAVHGGVVFYLPG